MRNPKPTPNDKNSKKFTPDEIASIFFVLVGVVCGALLPVITFWWRFSFCVGCIVIAIDLCLRSQRIKVRPVRRLLLSLACSVIIVGLLWNPMREQYMREHLPPSIIFVMGNPLGENESPVWDMMTMHYGPNPATNCDLEFLDSDRVEVRRDWINANPGYSFAPENLVGAPSHQLHYDEVDPLHTTVGHFQWTPLDPDRQHYSINIGCRDGDFVENWEVTRVEGVLYTKLVIASSSASMERNPDLPRILYACTDKKFGDAPLVKLSELDQNHKIPVINPGFKTFHAFNFPVEIVSDNRHFYSMNAPSGYDPGCWILFNKHLGDPVMPLTFFPLDADRLLRSIIIVYGLLTLVLPLYSLLALRIMGAGQEEY